MATCRGAHGRGFLQGANHVNDTLYGLDGNDTLDREAGNDSLNGMFYNDTLHGGKGNGGQPDRGKIVASAVYLDFGITGAITGKHREYPEQVVLRLCE